MKSKKTNPGQQNILSLISQKFDQQNQKIDQRFNQVDVKFEKIDQRFNQVDVKFEKIDKRFTRQDETIKKRFQKQDQKMDLRFTEQDKKMDQRFTEQEKSIMNQFAQFVEDNINPQFEELRSTIKNLPTKEDMRMTIETAMITLHHDIKVDRRKDHKFLHELIKKMVKEKILSHNAFENLKKQYVFNPEMLNYQ